MKGVTRPLKIFVLDATHTHLFDFSRQNLEMRNDKHALEHVYGLIGDLDGVDMLFGRIHHLKRLAAIQLPDFQITNLVARAVGAFLPKLYLSDQTISRHKFGNGKRYGGFSPAVGMLGTFYGIGDETNVLPGTFPHFVMIMSLK